MTVFQKDGDQLLEMKNPVIQLEIKKKSSELEK